MAEAGRLPTAAAAGVGLIAGGVLLVILVSLLSSRISAEDCVELCSDNGVQQWEPERCLCMTQGRQIDRDLADFLESTSP